MRTPTGNLTAAVAEWHEASDAFAVQLSALENRVPHALQKLSAMQLRLRECKETVDELTASSYQNL